MFINVVNFFYLFAFAIDSIILLMVINNVFYSIIMYFILIYLFYFLVYFIFINLILINFIFSYGI